MGPIFSASFIQKKLFIITFEQTPYRLRHLGWFLFRAAAEFKRFWIWSSLPAERDQSQKDWMKFTQITPNKQIYLCCGHQRGKAAGSTLKAEPGSVPEQLWPLIRKQSWKTAGRIYKLRHKTKDVTETAQAWVCDETYLWYKNKKTETGWCLKYSLIIVTWFSLNNELSVLIKMYNWKNEMLKKK